VLRLPRVELSEYRSRRRLCTLGQDCVKYGNPEQAAWVLRWHL